MLPGLTNASPMTQLIHRLLRNEERTANLIAWVVSVGSLVALAVVAILVLGSR